MKKLVFNGCSFMAGDAFVWEQYHKDNNKPVVAPWNNKNELTDAENLFRDGYLKYRQSFNLPAIITRMLDGDKKIDLSHDGKSNENIAIGTIVYLNNLSKEERENCHVIIGWTCLSRITKYSKISNTFVDLAAGHYDKHTSNPAKNALKDHIKTRILGGDDEDFILDYVRNVMLLENYLIANNVSYTFYRALDDMVYGFEKIGPFNYNDRSTLNVKDCSRHENWYKFTDDNYTPINSLGWGVEFFEKPQKWISLNNTHPNMETINDFASRLVEFIKKQNLL
jgi:hypothetical protein